MTFRDGPRVSGEHGGGEFPRPPLFGGLYRVLPKESGTVSTVQLRVDKD